MKTYDELVSLFEEANLVFLQAERSLFRTEIAERTLCGALMLHIHDIIKEDDSYAGYYTDVEYLPLKSPLHAKPTPHSLHWLLKLQHAVQHQ